MLSDNLKIAILYIKASLPVSTNPFPSLPLLLPKDDISDHHLRIDSRVLTYLRKYIAGAREPLESGMKLLRGWRRAGRRLSGCRRR